jgi:hypothetical protein
MLPEIQDIIARFVFAEFIDFHVSRPINLYLPPGGELVWHITTPLHMSKCGCVARAWNAALRLRLKTHVAALAARSFVKYTTQYSLNMAEIERYNQWEMQHAPVQSVFMHSLKLNAKELVSVRFTRKRVVASNPLVHELTVQVGAPHGSAYRLSDMHVSALPDVCWIHSDEILDDELDDFRRWYSAKKLELQAWLRGALVEFGVMPLALM